MATRAPYASERQWHLLRRLEGSNGLALGQLVEAVPDDFPKNGRTARRDLEAMEAVVFRSSPSGAMGRLAGV